MRTESTLALLLTRLSWWVRQCRLMLPRNLYSVCASQCLISSGFRKLAFRADSQLPKSRSIKGDVKKNTSAATGGHLVIQPCVVMRRCDFAFPQVHCHFVAMPFGF